MVSLDGEWEFYWLHLLTPDDFAAGVSASGFPPGLESERHLVTIPEIWNRHNVSLEDGSTTMN